MQHYQIILILSLKLCLSNFIFFLTQQIFYESDTCMFILCFFPFYCNICRLVIFYPAAAEERSCRFSFLHLTDLNMFFLPLYYASCFQTSVFTCMVYHLCGFSLQISTKVQSQKRMEKMNNVETYLLIYLFV